MDSRGEGSKQPLEHVCFSNSFKSRWRQQNPAGLSPDADTAQTEKHWLSLPPLRGFESTGHVGLKLMLLHVHAPVGQGQQSRPLLTRTNAPRAPLDPCPLWMGKSLLGDLGDEQRSRWDQPRKFPAEGVPALFLQFLSPLPAGFHLGKRKLDVTSQRGGRHGLKALAGPCAVPECCPPGACLSSPGHPGPCEAGL